MSENKKSIPNVKHDHSHAHECRHEHNHSHGDECGCGHEHGHSHGDECGCGHEHGHSHGDECGCGHEHGHSHGDECGCGHEHGHSHEHNQDAPHGKPAQIYILENLGCANCAAKMEKQIRELPGITYASITYATKQLRVSGDHPEKMLSEFQKICTSIESEVKVIPRNPASSRQPNQKSSEKKKVSKNTKEGLQIGSGAILFILGKALEGISPAASTVTLLLAYAILGGRIILTAAKHLLRGQIFDENFLMSLATLSAIAIADYAEAVGVMLFYRIGELFEEIAVAKSRGQIMDAVDMRPEVVNLISGDGTSTVIAAEEATVGDLLLVRPGDRIPLDGTIEDGESRIDTSPVTGEPVPVKAAAGDTVISGCVNTSGLLKIRVEKPLAESMVTKILDSVENAAANKPKIDRFITKFARIYTPFVVLLALGTAIIPSLVTGDWNHWIYTAITFLVISCPCALVLSVPLAFFSGIGAGSKRGILFKGGVSLEALKDVKAVVMDKTGTITKGNFAVQDCVPVENITAKKLLALAAGCELTSTHPIGISIVSAARKQGLSLETPTSLKEISGKGIQAGMSGKEVLCGNRKLMEAFGVNLSDYRPDQFGTEVLLAIDRIYAGHLVISDTLKEEAPEAVKALKNAGITTAMLTGDAKESAEAIAAKTGIDEVHAKLLPEEKLSELKKIRARHGAVMFVGDGINDAPVLAGADVGAAMGSGADAAIEAADVVFMTSSVSAIPESIQIARGTGRIAMQNVVLALVIKALVMVLGLAGYANMWMAVFADTGVAMICVLNSIRILYKK